ncbi:unnamed protein product [Notodromas monacha]|uniref:Glycosyltransferase 61 catalytic domain-containing protein n=1 Tax=Notodromas monacha TaxID=399045 RepID=A0A7R9GJS7_9CRUS|nr:unnamed protein product [Notodromas monacha]CAG0923889.1 unnamed protein product [Notodromas monacha]
MKPLSIPRPTLYNGLIPACAAALFFYVFTADKAVVQTPSVIISTTNASIIQHDLSTRVYCRGDSFVTRRCTIFNLCVSPQRDTFIFLTSPQSQIVGVPREEVARSDRLLDASSIADHNMMHLVYTTLPLEMASQLKMRFINESVFIMNPFLPSNMAHTLLDDLIPLFFTYDELCFGDIYACIEKYRLVLLRAHANYAQHPHSPLYAAFSRRSIWNLAHDEFDDGDYVCFSRAEVGLRKDVKYYDFASAAAEYEQPMDSSLEPEDTERFVKFIEKRLCELAPGSEVCTQATCAVDPNAAKVLVLNRQKTRRILNLDELVNLLEDMYADDGNAGRKTVELVSLETHSLIDLICKTKTAKMIIGVHGALMKLAFFLKPGTAVVELFPYALNPDNYQIFRTICEKLKVRVRYWSWANTNRNHTIYNADFPHPGVITHLSHQDQLHIQEMTQVPRLDCCNDKRFHYWLHRDSIVDTETLAPILISALDWTRDNEEQQQRAPQSTVVVPAPEQLRIDFDGSSERIIVTWKPPQNFAVYQQKFAYLVNFLDNVTGVLKTFVVGVPRVDVPYDNKPLNNTMGEQSLLISVEVVPSNGLMAVGRKAYLAVII